MIIVLGCSPVTPSAHNPLSFLDREQMIGETISGVTVMPLDDTTQDDVWSFNLDWRLDEILKNTPARLYGRKDTVVERYVGRYPCEVFEPEETYTQKQIYDQLTANANPGVERRIGVIQATLDRYPAAFPTVDIAILSNDEQQVLLGRKPNEDLWRLPGGFAEPWSESFEDDAAREAEEETGVVITDPVYVGSFKGKDWRYRLERDKIKTLLFTAKVGSGTPQAGDDLEEVKWFPISQIANGQIIDSHHVLIDRLRELYVLFPSIETPDFFTDSFSVMDEGKELAELRYLIGKHPAGVLSVPADQFNVYRFVGQAAKQHRDEILARDGILEFRVSTVGDHETPEGIINYLTSIMGSLFGCELRDGQVILNPKVRLIWVSPTDQFSD